MKIVTNGVQRHLLNWEHLTTAEQRSLPMLYQEIPIHVSDRYFRYSGKVYPVLDFRPVPEYINGRWRHSDRSSGLHDWDQFLKTGPGGGLLIRSGDTTDQVVVGTFDEIEDD